MPELRLAQVGCDATAETVEGGVLVRAGSTGRAAAVPSFERGNYLELRRELLESGVLQVDGEHLILTQDHLFASPTAASNVLLGRPSNGRRDWRLADGSTLAEWESRTTVSDETRLRRLSLLALRDRFIGSHELYEAALARLRGFEASAEEALELLAQLRRDREVDAFRAGLQAWAVKDGTLAFNGFSGQMMLNQLVKNSDDHGRLADVLVEALSLPIDDSDAVAKIRSLVDYVETIRVGAHPAPGHVPFLCSYFWALADRGAWPLAWASAVQLVEFLTGDRLPDTSPERYAAHLELTRALTDDYPEFEITAAWWDEERPVAIDPVIMDRCEFGLDESRRSHEELEANAKALVSVARHLGDQLVDDVSSVLGTTIKAVRPPLGWRRDEPRDRPRSDMWIDFHVTEGPFGLRLWANQNGLSVGLKPGMGRAGWLAEVAELIEDHPVDGYELIGAQGSPHRDVGYMGRQGEYVYSRWWDKDAVADVDVRAELLRAAADLQPLVDEMRRAWSGQPVMDVADDPLAPYVERFHRERGYPSSSDEENRADRGRFAELLSSESIGVADIAELRQIWNTGRYGGPGPQSRLNSTIRDAGAAEYDRIIAEIDELCWGEDPDAVRIDRLLEDPAHQVPGLGESVVMKLLSICHPDRYVPVFPYSGPNGKRALLHALDLPIPDGGTRGEIQVAANTTLYERLEPFFPRDPWGMVRFAYWYRDRPDDDEADAGPTLEQRLDQLAEELFVDRDFLTDVVELLEDKGQVIFYGPPGTGKTYLARKLAEILAPDPTRRSLVQFHPSTSYEDFFEGYRPESIGDGDLSYRLTPGPLALLAERAAESPGHRHVMIIDEINRANLPKVFGELLFLLEYRDEQVRTLYRPDDAFELPKGLWFIGTMNTADRSIALVDAALRRRFHFVPFFPNEPPMAGLLDRWLVHHNPEQAWIGQLLAHVNDELERQLGGSHLLIGPSHFMDPDLDRDKVSRIWRYNIKPFIEDQFFGDTDTIESFSFDAVVKRFEAQAALDENTAGLDLGSQDTDPASELSSEEPSDGAVEES